MTSATVFAGVRRVLLDTGPTIDALEKNVEWGPRTKAALEYLFDAGIEVISTPVTLAECIAGAPPADIQPYVEFLTRSGEITFVTVDATASVVAGRLRQTTGLKLPDCLQVAMGLAQGCDLLLTNDLELARRQSAIRTLMIADLNP